MQRTFWTRRPSRFGRTWGPWLLLAALGVAYLADGALAAAVSR